MSTQTKDLLALAEKCGASTRTVDYGKREVVEFYSDDLVKFAEAIRASATSAPKKTLTNKQIDAIGATVFKADFLDKVEVAMNRELVRKAEAAHGIGTPPQPAKDATP